MVGGFDAESARVCEESRHIAQLANMRIVHYRMQVVEVEAVREVSGVDQKHVHQQQE
jgi:hypothetical protein